MKTLIALFFFFLSAQLSLAFGSEESQLRLKNPFVLPQTSFYIQSVNETIDVSNQYIILRQVFNKGGINAYGFNIETNANSFTNIGASFRWKRMEASTYSMILGDTLFGISLGGFGRFFYIPPFLKYKSTTGSLFTRVDLSLGPTFIGASAGVLGEASISAGAEIYFSKWFGMGLGYSVHQLYGAETLRNSSKLDDAGLKKLKFSGGGSSFQIYLKSTYL